MKKLMLPFVVLLACNLAGAHSLLPEKLSVEDQQLLTETLQRLQSCFSRIDPNQVAALQQRADRVANELRDLCIESKRTQAQQEAKSFYAAMTKEPAIRQAEACADEIPDKFADFLSTPLNLSQYESDDHHHICDREILPLDQYSGHHH